MSDIKVETLGSAVAEVMGSFAHTDIYVGLVDTFDAMVEPKERNAETGAATTLAELVTITEAHTFKAGFGFTKVKAVQNSISLEYNQIGDVNKSTAIENKMTFELLGSEAEILGAMRLWKGRDLVVMGRESESGRLRQIGSLNYAAKMQFEGRIESDPEGDNTVTVTVTDKQKYPAPIYTGAVTLQPAA